MHADVHKRAEIDHVPHRPRQLHSRLQVLDVQHVRPQHRLGQLVTGVPPRLLKLRNHVLQRRQPDADLRRQFFLPEGPRLQGNLRNPALQVLQVISQFFQQSLRRIIALRVHPCRVQRILAVRHPQESRALLKGLRPKLRHLFQRLPGRNPVLLPIGNDVLRQRRPDPGHVAQQLRRGGGHFHAHLVHALLHDAVQRLRQLVLLQVVLILPHADGLRINLHQLRQRVLHPPCDGNGAPLRHVEVRKLLRRQLARGIDGSPGFAHDHVGHPRHLRQQRNDELFALPAGRAVADGDRRHPVFRDHTLNQPRRRRFPGLISGQREISDSRVQNLPVLVHHRQLASGPESGVYPQRHLALDRRLHQQLVQILRKNLDGRNVRPVRQLVPNLPLKGWENQPFPRVAAGFRHLGRNRAAAAHIRPPDALQGLLLRNLKRDLQIFFPLAPVHRQNPVGRHAPHRLPEVVVHAVNAVLFLRRFGHQHAFPHHHPAQRLPDVRVVADGLGQNVPRSGQGALRVRHFLFRVDVFPGLRHGIPVRILHHQPKRQRFQSPFLRHGGPRPPLRPVRPVKVLQLAQRPRRRQFSFQLLRQHVLLRQALADLLPPLVQVPQVFKPLRHLPQNLVVQRPRGLFPIPRDKGNRIPRVQKLHRRRNLRRPQTKLRSQNRNIIHKKTLLIR